MVSQGEYVRVNLECILTMANVLGPEENSEAHKEEMEEKGVILPSTVDNFTRRRTELTIDINEQIPKESPMFLKSTFNASPDVLHMIVRSVESDLKLYVDSLIVSDEKAFNVELVLLNNIYTKTKSGKQQNFKNQTFLPFFLFDCAAHEIAV